MTLEKRKLLHGLVIRISGDTGEQIGAHVEYVERIIDTDTGTVEAAKMLPPEPLQPGADALTPLIGEVVRVQQQALAHAERQVAALSDALDTAQGETAALAARLEVTQTQSAGELSRLQGALLGAEQQAATLGGALSTVQAENAALQDRNDQLLTSLELSQAQAEQQSSALRDALEIVQGENARLVGAAAHAAAVGGAAE